MGGDGMSASSGFRPDQEQDIARQYTSPEKPSMGALAAAWRCSAERIRAALESTGTPIRKRGNYTSHGGATPHQIHRERRTIL
jgi:hypothetical protein